MPVETNLHSSFIRTYRKRIVDLARRHGAHSVSVFGSLARGEDDAGSDIDLLIDLDSDRSLLDIVSLKLDIEDLTGRKVDIVTRKGISPYLAKQILEEAVPL